MKFWDSSALVPLLVEQADSKRMQRILHADVSITVWWATVVECASAVTRLEREGKLTDLETEEALANLDRLANAWTEVVATLPVMQTARRLLRTHPLGAADGLQLAAAIMVVQPNAGAPDFVCLDERLATAARREGFRVLGASAERRAAD